MDFLEELKNYLGKRVDNIIELIKKPFRRYYLRINTLKISVDEFLDLMKDKGYKFFKDNLIEEAVYFIIEENKEFNDIECRGKIFVDRYAGESLMIGADLYRPGIKYLTKFNKGDIVCLIYKNYVVAKGIALYDSKEILKIEKGLVVKNIYPRYKSYKLKDMEEYNLGYFYPQSFSSMFVVRKVLNPLMGEKILDMCSAPGGKLGYIYQLIKNAYGVDRGKNKIMKIKWNFERLGYYNVKILNYDARYLDRIFKPNSFDKILLDPPCSSLGVRPKLEINKKKRDIINYSNYQKQFIKIAYKLLKPNGILVYSTCTITLEENEKNILYALKNFNFKLEELDEKYYKMFDRGIKIEDNLDLTLRILPDKFDTTAFFIAKLRKIK